MVTPADHGRLHPVGEQDALGRDGVAVFGAGGQLERGVDPARRVDIALGVLRLGHWGAVTIAVEDHAGGVGIEEPGVEPCLGLHGLHPGFQQWPNAAWIGVVARLLEAGLELAVLQHDGTLAVSLAAQVGGGPVRVFGGG